MAPILRRTGILALILAACWANSAGAAAQDIDIAKKNLPAGAFIENFTVLLSNGHSQEEPAVVSGPLDSTSSPSVALIYNRNGLLGLRVVTSGPVASGNSTLDAPLPGSFLQAIEPNSGPVAIKGLIPGAPPAILAATSEGASAGSYLSVFAIQGAALRNLTGTPIGGSSFGADCTGAGACKLLAWGKWTDHSSAWVHVWDWNGQSYAQNDAESEKYAAKKLSEISSEAASATKLPVFLRVAMARLAAGEYTDRGNSAQALSLSNKVLSRLDDRTVSLPRPGASDKLDGDIENGKAAMHETIGKVYQAMGRASEAATHFSEARQIRQAASR